MSQQPLISNNLALLATQVEEYCQQYHRVRDTVRILAVSKTKPVAMIKAAAITGQKDFGENYLQEAISKISECADMGLSWHFIGPIQSNKTRSIAAHFDWVHTVANLKTARRLNDQRPDSLEPLNILLQVNISQDPAKAGMAPGEVAGVLEEILPMARLKPRGLMTIPAQADTLAAQRQPFQALRELQIKLREQYNLPAFDQLSMGMSGDYEIAIACDSNMIRVGSSIFGARNYSN